MTRPNPLASRAALALAVMLVAACAAPREPAGSPATSTATAAPTGIPTSPATAAPVSASPSPAAVSGEVSISNTTPGGAPVLVESLVVRLEAAPSDDAGWAVVAATCSTEPPAPVSFADELVVRYVCAPGPAGIPAGARVRAVVEARIAGSDQVFRLESELLR